MLVEWRIMGIYLRAVRLLPLVELPFDQSSAAGTGEKEFNLITVAYLLIKSRVGDPATVSLHEAFRMSWRMGNVILVAIF